MKFVVGSLGLCGVCFRWSRGLYCLIVGYHIFLVSSCVALFLKWLEWSMALGGNHSLDEHGHPWTASTQDKLFMIFFTIEHLLIYIMSLLVVFGVLRSNRMVLECGGTGWELKNYREVVHDRMIDSFIEDL
eukprot:Gregarina_sp_Poly_1__9052@NODE_552_length_7553_cov_144_990516_g437_i0_p6_GENE_NODE_552_length_7553_cov_144_990516_g437_i0NODE_552_length_7553_cov_144_990516_g437_i0_p6_ORF_typecomplete_len131_score4_52SHP/PF03579_13/0_19_NODE_552_length_7553_cov_144_990516_g437_i059916383